MDTLFKLANQKDNAEIFAIGFLIGAYLMYFPASLSEGSDVAFLYSLSPVLGNLSNFLLAVIVTIIAYVLFFSVVNYIDSYFKVPMFFITAIACIGLSLTSVLGIEGFLWVNFPLSCALFSIGIAFISILKKVAQRASQAST
ncbi:hypothetical protein [Vibrio vulnificus]|uniref:hypothetical protein n=1 Tax=Vibrio vulnificus TaxID=672 RepID=UPI00102B60CD|nr:hypothetical protein [Vibrio vulnificus]EJC6737725.1 hypothetical protein [Vibrio vulnificus]RZQ83142.1 hypothetical protein D8T27_22235 [Vibrio vulnificus]